MSPQMVAELRKSPEVRPFQSDGLIRHASQQLLHGYARMPISRKSLPLRAPRWLGDARMPSLGRQRPKNAGHALAVVEPRCCPRVAL